MRSKANRSINQLIYTKLTIYPLARKNRKVKLYRELRNNCDAQNCNPEPIIPQISFRDLKNNWKEHGKRTTKS